MTARKGARSLLLQARRMQDLARGMWMRMHCGQVALLCAVQEVVVAEVEKRKDQVHCVLCLGHNKGMEEAATSLAVSHSIQALSDMIGLGMGLEGIRLQPSRQCWV